MYYYEPKRRAIISDPVVLQKLEELTAKRPSFGTRRKAAMPSRDLGRSVNRKQVEKIFRILGWVDRSLKKSEIIRALANQQYTCRKFIESMKSLP